MAVTNTLIDVRELCRIALNDPTDATWADATLDAWVSEAIRDYSIHFKRLATDLITTAAGDHDYALPYDVHEILLVEYPYSAFDDPPFDTLDLLSRKDPAFWLSDRYYDFEPAYQEQSELSGASPPLLYISASPAANETIRVTYHSNYFHASECLVPEHHLPLLIMYVQWKAAAERLFTELQGPDYNNIIIGHMRGVVEQAREAYERALRQATQAQSRARWTEPWSLDAYDRVY